MSAKKRSKATQGTRPRAPRSCKVLGVISVAGKSVVVRFRKEGGKLEFREHYSRHILEVSLQESYQFASKNGQTPLFTDIENVAEGRVPTILAEILDSENTTRGPK